MQIKQSFSLLLFPKRENKQQESATIYARITIDGLDEEFSLSIKIQYKYWLKDSKSVDQEHPDFKNINSKLRAAETDLERHFLLVQAKNGIALPTAVIKSYQTPVNGKDLITQKQEYENFQSKLEILLWDYIRFCEKRKRIINQDAIISDRQKLKLDEDLEALGKSIKAITKEAFKIFDDKSREKTLAMAIDEYLLNFLQQVHTNNKAYTTLEKWMGRRQRYIEFLKYRFQKNDLPLAALEYSFMDDLTNYCKLIHEVSENTAMNYAKHLKSVMNRINNKGWISHNIFSNYKCPYVVPPAPTYMTKEQFHYLMNYSFEREDNDLSLIRDIVVFACFTGLSYAELYNLAPHHIRKGDDGELWIGIGRQKTGEEEKLPMLPKAAELVEKFREHPVCIRRGKVLPMPTNEHWNRSLKRIEGILKFNIPMDGHHTRYFFMNVITYNNGVDRYEIKDMVGHAKISSTDHYLRGNKSKVSETMQILKQKLSKEDGKLINSVDRGEFEKGNEHFKLKVVHLRS